MKNGTTADARTLVIQLEAWVQEELAGQERMLRELAKQEEAIAGNSAQDLVAAGTAVEAELATGPARAEKRERLVRAFSSAWSVPAAALTLGSIAERASADGIDVERLRRLRADLRTACAAVLKKGRKIAAMARYHQGFLSELLRVVAGGSPGPDGESLTLVDARG